MKTEETLTWEKVVSIEPKLAELEGRVKLVERGRRQWLKTPKSDFCANWVWFTYFKPQMVKLVGWGATNRDLRSEAAYDLVYDHLYSLLPDCQHDSPLCV